MDWLGDNELLLFFRRSKTVMSCMENPQTFLRQLRDHDLLLEDRYQVRGWSGNAVVITFFFIHTSCLNEMPATHFCTNILKRPVLRHVKNKRQNCSSSNSHLYLVSISNSTTFLLRLRPHSKSTLYKQHKRTIFITII